MVFREGKATDFKKYVYLFKNGYKFNKTHYFELEEEPVLESWSLIQ